MSRAPTVAAPPRPLLVDYVFLLVGGSLSLYLLRLSPLLVKPAHAGSSSFVREFVAFLPSAMRLPEGIVLMGPVFYLIQLVRRRAQGLTALEWLWLLNGLGVALLTGLAVWERSGTLPDFARTYASTPRHLWYLIFAPSMAALAVVLGILGVLRRGVSPWTHTLSLALTDLAGAAAAGHPQPREIRVEGGRHAGGAGIGHWRRQP